MSPGRRAAQTGNERLNARLLHMGITFKRVWRARRSRENISVRSGGRAIVSAAEWTRIERGLKQRITRPELLH